MSINYAKRAKPATTCLHHITITRIQLAADAMRNAGLTPRTADLGQLPACTCR